MNPYRPALALLLCLAASAKADKVVLVAGGGEGEDGSPAIEARLKSPFGLGPTPSGGIAFVEMTGHRVRSIGPDGIMKTLAGTGREGKSGDGGPGLKAEFKGMHDLAVAPDGILYIADTWNNRVRKLDPKSGEITTVVGTGEAGFSGDGGPATGAKFGGIYSIALTPDGSRMILADLDNRRIRAVDLEAGTVATFAGDGRKGVPRDGEPATASPLVDPRAVAVDASGNVYILERGGHALRVVDPRGKIRTVAGTGKAGGSGDGGPALEATLDGPKGLAMDRDGGVLIADTENHLIRKYQPADGRIVRVVGTGRKGSKGLGGSPEAVELSQPHGIAVDRNGDLLISDSSNHRILRVVREAPPASPNP